MNYDFRKYFGLPETPSPSVRACMDRQIAIAAQLPRAALQPLPPDKAAKLLLIAVRNALKPCDDPHVLAAHKFLKDNEELAPPLNRVKVADLTEENCRGICDAGGKIRIDPHCDFYQAAERGDVLPLAMLLNHEAYHALIGSNERQAFAASLRFLERHHAPQHLIDRVTADAIEHGTE